MDCKKFWLEKPTFQRGKWELSSPSYGSGLKEIWLNPDVSHQNGWSTKWIQWNRVSWWRKCLLCNAIKAGPSGWPWRWTCNLWWLRGLFALNPLGVAKLRLESREISISLWKKHDVETDIRQKRSEFLLLGKEKWMVYCERVFCLCQRELEGLKMFSLENEKTKDYFSLLFQSQKEEIEGGYTQTKKKLKTIEVVFICSKRSTGFWYCERYQGPEGTSGARTVIKTCSVFSFFEDFF